MTPHQSKLVPLSAFDLIEPVTFSSVELLQAARQGLRLTHNADMLAQNRQLYKKSAASGKGAMIAVDVESYEQEHSVILEIGWAYLRWTAGTDENPRMVIGCEHMSGLNLRRTLQASVS